MQEVNGVAGGKTLFQSQVQHFLFPLSSCCLVSVSTQILGFYYCTSSYCTFWFEASKFSSRFIHFPQGTPLYWAIFFGYICYGTGVCAVLHFLLSAFSRKSCCSAADSMNRLCDSTILEFFSFLGFVSAYRLTVLLCCCDCYGREIPTQYYTQQIFLHKNVALW